MNYNQLMDIFEKRIVKERNTIRRRQAINDLFESQEAVDLIGEALKIASHGD